MHNIGNEEEARVIAAWVRSFDMECGVPTCAYNEEAPDGWEFLGRGSFRSVWLSPTGVAYKVSHHEHYQEQSEKELDNLGRAWAEYPPKGCRLPRFDGFTVGDDDLVVAIEKINGVTLYEYDRTNREGRDRLYKLLHEIEDEYELADMHDENAIVDEDGLLVPVDFGG